ncbi:hypothetical protein YC2023_064875 [Brassica napus]|uniref:(rape) hypothetical protein n=1 Tax=Brassica napus TaxID=3708 RepID=A0A816TBW7_BRANA|nr:unnamed protein product [Brassica napus]
MSIVGLILCFEPISLCISTTNTVYCLLQIQIYGYTGGRSIKIICKTILSLQAHIVPCYDCGSMHRAMQLNKVHYVMIGRHHCK